MKIKIFLAMSIFLMGSLHCFTQERSNEVRQKISAKVVAASEEISKVIGWSKIENTEGKFWQKSDLNDEVSYLPGYSKQFAGFRSFRIYEISIEGNTFYILNKVLPDNSNKYVVFNQTPYFWLEFALNDASGKDERLIPIQYCGYQTGLFNPELLLQDKEMMRVLLLGKGSYEYYESNRCKGDSVFLINSQIIKRDTIVRFNFELYNNQTVLNKSIVPINEDYFELKLNQFKKIFHLSPYPGYAQEKIIKEKNVKQNDSILFDKVKVYYEKLNSMIYCKWDSCKGRRINNEIGLVEYNYEYPHLLKIEKDLSQLIDSTKIINKEIFEVVVDSRGKVAQSPKLIPFFRQLKFTPGKMQAYFGKDYKEKYKDISLSFNEKDKYWSNFDRTMSIPVAFVMQYDYMKPKTIVKKFIVKFKKSSEGITIENKYSTDNDFYDSLSSKIMVDKNFENLKNGRYYIYFTRISHVWNLVTFPEYSSNSNQHDMYKYAEKSEDLFTSNDKLEIKPFDYFNKDERCP